jgi:GntR family transcriptional regulator, arabinose operon transcriptional repressor
MRSSKTGHAGANACRPHALVVDDSHNNWYRGCWNELTLHSPTMRHPDQDLLTLDLRRQHPSHAKYERLRDHLVQQMREGRLKPGQALPSEQRLVKSLGMARTTVRQAMAALENDGLIRRVQGKGTFVDDNAQRRLRRGLDIFALVVPETRGGFYPSLLHGFEAAAAEIHHQTIICNTDENVERQGDIILQLLDEKVGGVALNPTSLRLTPAYQVRQLREHGIPLVFCHRGVEGITAPLLALPFYEIGQLAGKVLAEHGHRRVAFMASDLRSSARNQYEAGLREALQAASPDACVQPVYVPGWVTEVEEGPTQRALQEAFARPDRPTAIFTTFDSMAETLYLMLPQMGLRIPEDVSLLGIGGTWREGAITRRLCSVVVDETATGRKAVELLDEMRSGQRPIDDGTEFAMEVSLSRGETLAPPGP